MQELERILEEIEQKKCEHIDKDYIFGSGDIVNGLDMAMEIIRKRMNDGWIPVQDKLPEDDVYVLITYADIDDENYTDICITTYGYAYLGGHKLDFKEWRSPFEYFKTNYKVIAWRPLPEPYRPEQPETCKYTGGSCCWPIDQCGDCPNHPERSEKMTNREAYERDCEELEKYREIGTVEECREAVEKQKPKKPHRNYKKFSGLWCKCGWYLGQKQCLDIKYCPNCGQRLKWRE